MRVVGLQVEDLKEADIARERRAQRAAYGQNSAEGPVPPLLLHGNLHLTTTVRPSRFRVTKTISLRALNKIFGVRAWLLLLLSAPLRRSSQTTQGLISGQLVDSVTGRPIAAASVVFSSATSHARGRRIQRRTPVTITCPCFRRASIQIRVTARRLPVAGSAGTGADRRGAHRARFPAASAQRCLGIRRIQERFSPRTKDHRNVLWSRRRSQQVRLV